MRQSIVPESELDLPAVHVLDHALIWRVARSYTYEVHAGLLEANKQREGSSVSYCQYGFRGSIYAPS